MAPVPIDKLKESRNTIQVNINICKTKLASHAVTKLKLTTVNRYIATLEGIDQRLATNYERIIDVEDSADMPAHTTIYQNMYQDVQDLMCDFAEIKCELQAATPIVAPPPVNPDLKLPALTLPKFDGNLQDWSSFKDIFKSTVIDNIKISNAQKLTYLKTVLSGDAEKLIRSISLTDANFDIAWDLLSSRYQNDRELLFHILGRLFNQPCVQAQSAQSLRSLIDVTKECIRSLESLSRPVDQWDDVLLYQTCQKLDQASRQLWEQSLPATSIPSLDVLMDFLEARARALAAGVPDTKHSSSSKPEGTTRRSVHHVSNHAGSSQVCPLCSNKEHSVGQCPKFPPMPHHEKREVVKRHRLCFNCLRPGHSSSSCNSKGVCRKCQQKHHSLLHVDRVHANEPSTTTATNPTNVPVSTTLMHTSGDACVQQTLLATAVVNVQNPRDANLQQVFRAMEDGCSNSSFVSERLVQRLGLPRTRVNVEITGVGGVSLGRTKGIATIVISPYFNNNERVHVNCFILPTVAGMMPESRCDPTVWPHLQGLQLADPNFHEPASVDILLGADVFWYHLLDGRRSGSPEAPVALKSTFGWLVAGNLNSVSNRLSVNMTTVDLDRRLQQFWEIESVPTSRSLTKEEEACESHFTRNTVRDETGRFVVKLPYKDPKPVLGHSRDIAVRWFKQLERRFAQNPVFATTYKEFMEEYINLGHMELVKKEDVYKSNSYYIPHHAVEKSSSTTTKLRVVFNASAATSTGVSLNDTLMVGPTIQDTLLELFTRFRVHPIAFTADLAKMYRQIKVHSDDTDMQRIVWRASPDQPLQDYRLLTVTYGTSSAPFLATRALKQLGIDGIKTHPLASPILQFDMYIDDLMSGGITLEKALQVQAELMDLSARGGFELRKWASNCKALCEAVPPENRETTTMLELGSDQTVKALGVYWNTTKDVFQFKLNLSDVTSTSVLSKRELSSEIAKTFDPLGWLAPVVIRAKILMQDSWKERVGWDDELPATIKQKWYEFKTELPIIEKITLNRCMVGRKYESLRLVGFSDASEISYSAVAYLVSYSEDGPTVSLISSKTRVAPAKPVSFPRLELCGALLLSQLLSKIKICTKIQFDETLAYCDSTIVLDWIRAHPSRWKTFVANRVTEIQELVPAESWSHVPGVENPADCASRGIDPAELPEHPLWWTGPSWLKSQALPKLAPGPSPNPEMVNLEQKSIIVCNLTQYDQSLMSRYSKLHELIRKTAWMRRLMDICFIRIQSKKMGPHKQLPSGPLTPYELQQAMLTWVKVVQDQAFYEEIHCLSDDKPLPSKSKILSLNPMLQSGILRVGGRLRNAPLPFERRNPILLPGHHVFTKMLIESEHNKNLHAGPDLLLSIITRKYWIISARDTIRHQVKKCVICTRHSAIMQKQMMGDLPAFRVTPARPFLRCGVDYAGPFMLRAIPGRSKVTFKAYLAVFVCFATRAIHLEVVSSLTADAFLATLRRMISSHVPVTFSATAARILSELRTR